MKQKKILGAALALALVAASGASAYAASPTANNATDTFLSMGKIKVEAVESTEGGLADFNFKDLAEFEMPVTSGGEIKFELIELPVGELENFGEMPATSGGTITINLVAAP